MRYRRRSIRLKDYDYTRPGVYFITMCTFERDQLFGRIKNGKMILNLFGQIVFHKWQNIPQHFKNAQLFEFQIMPDHFHGIILLTDINDNDTVVVGMKHSKQDLTKIDIDLAGNASTLHQKPRCNGTKPGSIPAIIQNYSSITTRKINQIRRTPELRIWQRGYYDRIIRNKKELIAIRKYVNNNPLNWK